MTALEFWMLLSGIVLGSAGTLIVGIVRDTSAEWRRPPRCIDLTGRARCTKKARRK